MVFDQINREDSAINHNIYTGILEANISAVTDILIR
jgi:hypothetical protein